MAWNPRDVDLRVLDADEEVLGNPQAAAVAWDPEDFDLRLLEEDEREQRRAEEVRENPPRAMEWVDLVVNAQPLQLILVGEGDRVTTRNHRYGRKRSVTIRGVSRATDEELRATVNQIARQGETWHVYAATEELKAKFTGALEGVWRAAPPEFVGCTKMVQTIEDPREQERIVQTYHEGETNHRGVRETVGKLSRTYFWDNMVRVVARVLKTCVVCKRNKADRRRVRPEQQLTPTPERPSELMETDLFTFDGQLYLTVIDRLTKEASAWPIQDKTARSVEKALRQCFAVVEPPDQLIMDQGREFKNERVEQRLEEWGIRPHWTTPGHSPSHGAVERLHATLSEHLLILRQARGVRGREAMDLAIHAYNRSIHRSHGLTPWEARRADAAQIGQRLREEKSRRIERVNRNCDTQPLVEGDVVYRRLYTRWRKTDPRFVGPYEVSQLLPRERVRLWRIGGPTHKTEVAHISELRKGRRGLQW